MDEQEQKRIENLSVARKQIAGNPVCRIELMAAIAQVLRVHRIDFDAEVLDKLINPDPREFGLPGKDRPAAPPSTKKRPEAKTK